MRSFKEACELLSVSIYAATVSSTGLPRDGNVTVKRVNLPTAGATPTLPPNEE